MCLYSTPGEAVVSAAVLSAHSEEGGDAGDGTADGAPSY